MIVLPYSFVMAMVGLIESLLTVTVIDEMTETRGDGNKESLAQGTANLVTGFFGGMGGCAMIGQSIINVSSGGRSRISGIVASVSLLMRSEEHTSELQSRGHLVCRLLREKKKR